MPGLAPALTDERSLLLAYLAQQRDGIRYAAFGLTDDQARLTPTAGALSIGGLVNHVADMETTWIDMVAPNSRHVEPRPREESDYDAGFRLEPGATLAGAIARYDDVAGRTEEVLRQADLDRPVPVPKGVPWFPDDVASWSVRWILLHLIEETARHAGHADIVRESIDGATMYELMAGAEGWPATDWITPWQPAS